MFDFSYLIQALFLYKPFFCFFRQTSSEQIVTRQGVYFSVERLCL